MVSWKYFEYLFSFWIIVELPNWLLRCLTVPIWCFEVCSTLFRIVINLLFQVSLLLHPLVIKLFGSLRKTWRWIKILKPWIIWLFIYGVFWFDNEIIVRLIGLGTAFVVIQPYRAMHWLVDSNEHIMLVKKHVYNFLTVVIKELSKFM